MIWNKILLTMSLALLFVGCFNDSTSTNGVSPKRRAEIPPEYIANCSTEDLGRAASVRYEAVPASMVSPVVDRATIAVNYDGSVIKRLYLNVPLADSSERFIVNNLNTPSMLVLRDSVAYGFYVTAFRFLNNKGVEGVEYEFDGSLVDVNGSVISGGLKRGDRIAFNVPWTQGLEYDGNEEHDFTYKVWMQLMIWAKLMTFSVASESGNSVDGFDAPEDWGEVSVYCLE